MRYFIGVLVLTFITSCSYFDKKKISEQEILDEELKTVNWNDVDEYPSFEDCEKTELKVENKICFESKLAEHTLLALEATNYLVSESISDTIFMSFQIDQNGDLQIKKIVTPERIESQLPEIDSILRASIKNTPKILPAIKRGQPVRTEFNLPIIVRSN